MRYIRLDEDHLIYDGETEVPAKMVPCVDEHTMRTVYVEIGTHWSAWFGWRFWWMTYLLPKDIGGVCVYPHVCLRAKPENRFSLRGFFHERWGHGSDQEVFADKYPDFMWFVRYLWRMVWNGWRYHDEIDERTADGVAERMYERWVLAGRPGFITLAQADRWANPLPLPL